MAVAWSTPERCLHMIPVLLVHALWGWATYAYCFVFLAIFVKSFALQSFLGCLYGMVFSLLAWSYWKTILTQPRKVPPEFSLTDEELVALIDDLDVPASITDRQLPLLTHDGRQRLRFCHRCQIIKPDRCHHCSACRQCVLKMDHHCPWVGNCVGHHNYKYFVLFLFYAVVFAAFIWLSCMQTFVSLWADKRGVFQDGAVHLLAMFMFAASCCASIGFMLVYHLLLLLNNRTTLETFRGNRFWDANTQGFSLSGRANIEQVFGPSARRWLLPVPTWSGDGVRFPTPDSPLRSRVRHMLTTLDDAAADAQPAAEPESATTVPLLSVSAIR